MGQASTRPTRRTRPALEGLEPRALLSTGAVHPSGGILSSRQVTTTPTPTGTTPTPTGTTNISQIPGRELARRLGITPQDRRLSYTTPEGTHVTITIYGVGSLAGSTVDPDGALNLVFSETNAFTGIVGRVRGGTGRAPLRSIHHLNLSPLNLSGVGSSLLDVVNLKDFDLVDNGQINLTGGVHALFLNSVGRNTQIHLRELPVQFLTAQGGTTSTSNGVNLQFIDDVIGARTLTVVGGQFVAGFNLLAQPPVVLGALKPGPPPAPPGVVAVISHIHGAPVASNPLGDAEIFGYDPSLNALVRFDAATGAALQVIPLAGTGMPIAGVALGRDNGRLVALVGGGTTILAFDALTGAPVGQFTTANLASRGLTSIDGIGSTDTRTVISDSSSTPDGVAQIIDVTASLASGQAVPVGSAFSPSRQFELAGGLTGIPGSNAIYALGAAHFDTFQPDLTQFGFLTLDTTNGRLSESSRAPLKNQGAFVNAGPAGTEHSSPVNALGSLNQSLAAVTGVSNGANVVTLYSPTTLANQGTITLDDPNRLAGLSESFYPNLVGSALIDVQGNVQSIRGQDANGLVLNVLGNLNLVKFPRASNSVIVGEPFGHAEIPHRSNVTILTTPRSVGDRNGVTVVNNLRPIGPLSLP